MGQLLVMYKVDGINIAEDQVQTQVQEQNPDEPRKRVVVNG